MLCPRPKHKEKNQKKISCNQKNPEEKKESKGSKLGVFHRNEQVTEAADVQRAGEKGQDLLEFPQEVRLGEFQGAAV